MVKWRMRDFFLDRVCKVEPWREYLTNKRNGTDGECSLIYLLRLYGELESMYLRV